MKPWLRPFVGARRPNGARALSLGRRNVGGGDVQDAGVTTHAGPPARRPLPNVRETAAPRGPPPASIPKRPVRGGRIIEAEKIDGGSSRSNTRER